jgi:SPP1 family predicted phage head-tail adaptor
LKKRRAETVLNKRVQLLTETETVDALGEPVVSETVFCSTWAAVWPKSAKESMVNGQETGTVTHRVRIRYRAGVNHAMRVKYGVRTFKISQVINTDEANRWLDILATEEI